MDCCDKMQPCPNHGFRVKPQPKFLCRVFGHWWRETTGSRYPQAQVRMCRCCWLVKDKRYD